MHVITGLGRGGAERMLYTLCAKDTQSSAAELLVVSLQPGGVYRDLLTQAGVRVEDCGITSALTIPRGLLRLAGIIKREQPAILQGWMYHANGLAALALRLSGRRRLTKLIWGIRCTAMDVRNHSLLLRGALFMSRLLRREPDITIANSHAGRRDHLALKLIAEPCDVIENGVDGTAFQPGTLEQRRSIRAELGIADDTFTVITVARNDPMKDYPLLLEVARMIPDATFLAVGLGTETLPPLDNLHRLGARADVAELLGACDVLASPSAYGEGMSNSIAEAMACGLPVVATDVGDAARLIGEAGTIVRPRDAAALARAIESMRGDAPKRHAKGKAARERILEHFTVERVVARFRALHQGL